MHVRGWIKDVMYGLIIFGICAALILVVSVASDNIVAKHNAVIVSKNVNSNLDCDDSLCTSVDNVSGSENNENVNLACDGRRSDMNIVKVGDYEVGQGHPLLLMAGPCVLEGYEHSLMIGKEVKKIADKLGVPYVFKASYDKANRSSYSSFRGPGLEEGLKILAQIKKDLGVPVVSDIHETIQVEKAAEVLDILQIPAFLCRQTDLVYEAAKTGRVVNIKKGQFLAPWDMKNVLKKAEEAGNHNIMLTERGASFGYNALVTDMRSLAIMRELGYPVVMDATHSVQIPGGQGTTSGGQSQYVPHMARAAAAVGIDALFLEVHDNPEEALSDGPNMVRLDKLEKLLTDVLAIDKIVRG